MKRKGFSIVEVMVALVILGFIASGMLAVFWQGEQLRKRTRENSIAYNLIREKLEEKSSFISWPPVNEVRAAVTGFSGYERQVAVTNPYLGNTDLALLQVTVWWNNAAQSQLVETIKANY
jgi:prepilin-type N-terminal cleavage/methylation domain-containing protein